MSYSEIILRLTIAIAVGGIIGYEREFKNRPAGFRTHILVCVGAAVISMLQIYMVDETMQLIIKYPQSANAFKADIGRVGAQVISGVGFLGAGTIIHQKGSVKGLTTAASIWVVACIGLTIGMGYYFLSIASAIGVFGVLVVLKKFESRFFSKKKTIKIKFEYDSKEDFIEQLSYYFKESRIKIDDIEIPSYNEKEEGCETVLYTITAPRHIKSSNIIHELSKFNQVVRVSLV